MSRVIVWISNSILLVTAVDVVNSMTSLHAMTAEETTRNNGSSDHAWTHERSNAISALSRHQVHTLVHDMGFPSEAELHEILAEAEAQGRMEKNDADHS